MTKKKAFSWEPRHLVKTVPSKIFTVPKGQQVQRHTVTAHEAVYVRCDPDRPKSTLGKEKRGLSPDKQRKFFETVHEMYDEWQHGYRESGGNNKKVEYAMYRQIAKIVRAEIKK